MHLIEIERKNKLESIKVISIKQNNHSLLPLFAIKHNNI